MALTNRDQVGRALDLLQAGLAPFIKREVDRGIQNNRVGKDALRGSAAHESQMRSFPEGWDASALLGAMLDLWDAVFRFPLGPAERSLIHDLRRARNDWAHQKTFTGDAAFRALDDAERLLRAVSAPEAAQLAPMKDELLRVRFEERSREYAKRQKRKAAASGEPIAGLKPWREVITPHEDVFSGRYQQAEFAADLFAVHDNPDGVGREYGDPRQFFQRTFLTGGLRELITGAARRLAGEGGDPVVDLQTNFGGGKTHSMLALYHLFSGIAPADLPGVEEPLQQAGIGNFPKQVRRAVLVGTQVSPADPSKKPDGITTRTLWGELAWQLGGKKGYERIRRDDESATNPGAAFGELLREYGPCLILIDEWVAYARQLEDRSDLPAGSFDTQFSFAQNLTESVKQAGNCLLVISLPVSHDGKTASDSDDEEVGGIRGREALGRLRNVLGRVASSWKPATAEEGFEIVRRRLFAPMAADRFKHRDETARRFSEYYRENRNAFPAECSEEPYRRRIEKAYPIHPEVFDRLYEDWASALRFQRTRGVLRLMAGVIHELWAANDQGPLILPGMIPLGPGSPVRSELQRYLSDPWESILDQDVDGENALPGRLDEENPKFGQVQAARRSARAVFLGSASKATAAHRGIETRRVRLGAALPGQGPAVYSDALRRLAESATFLYEDGSRVWYDIQPTVAKLARDRAGEIPADKVSERVTGLLREAARERGAFGGVHVTPRDSAEVPDERKTRLVILSPEHLHAKDRSRAIAAAEAILENRGKQPRQYQNTLLFLAADEVRWADLEKAVRMLLAWDSILADKERLNLAHSQGKQAETRQKDAKRQVDGTLQEAYCILLAPEKEGAGAGVRWESTRLSASSGLVRRAAERAVREELMLADLGSSVLRGLLDSVPLWSGNHVEVQQLADYFAGLLELPRLAGPEVLAEAITRGLGLLTWKADGFAFAESWDEAEERYRGLSAGAAMRVREDSKGLLVHPDAVPAPEPVPTPDPVPDPVPTPDKPAPSRLRRFHGSVALHPDRIGPDAARIADEVIAHLAGLTGASVRVTLEIEAERPAGFPEQEARVVRENAGSLGFESHGFETE